MKYPLYFSLVFACSLAVARGVNPSDISYVFFSRENLNGVRVHYNENPNVVNIGRVFNARLPTVVLIHGWQDNFQADSNTFVRGAILSKLNANIIKVDWSPLSNQGYVSARNAVPGVGRLAAGLLSRISSNFGYSLNDVTLVGFSLGAHIAGHIGKTLGRGRIGVIVALDPAGPLINANDASFSVHPNDANFVQGIHTNGGTLGIYDPIGHADFYPNGGSRQPGCGIDLLGGCAHNRAWEFFAESVTNNRFVAQNCDNWNQFRNRNCRGGTSLMGGLTRINRNARGRFFLETNNRSPFGRG